MDIEISEEDLKALEVFQSKSDDQIMEELKSQKIDGLTPRGRLAVLELANIGRGETIFLILSLNSRIRELEKIIGGYNNGQRLN